MKKPTLVIKVTESSNLVREMRRAAKLTIPEAASLLGLDILDYMKLEASPKKLRLKRLTAVAAAFGFKFQLDCQL
jgi:transcriptional regulator with XRE-family HTH domain